MIENGGRRSKVVDCIEHTQKTKYASTSRKGVTEWKHRVIYCESNKLALADIKDKVVRHKCDNPRCINPAHLEIGTHADNMRDMTSRNRQAKGISHSASKLTDANIKYIREHYKPLSKDFNQYKLADMFGVDQTTISDVLLGNTWSHVKQDED